MINNNDKSLFLNPKSKINKKMLQIAQEAVLTKAKALKHMKTKVAENVTQS